MDIVKTFGSIIEKMAVGNPEGARRLLLTGYRAQRLMLSLRPCALSTRYLSAPQTPA